MKDFNEISMLSIDDMPSLAKRLGASGRERARYPQVADSSLQKGATNVSNTIIKEMQFHRPNTLGCLVNLYVKAAAGFNIDDSRPLNINRLFNILQCMEMVNTREVIKMTGLSYKQAMRYVRAVKFALPFLEKVFADKAQEDE